MKSPEKDSLKSAYLQVLHRPSTLILYRKARGPKVLLKLIINSKDAFVMSLLHINSLYYMFIVGLQCSPINVSVACTVKPSSSTTEIEHGEYVLYSRKRLKIRPMKYCVYSNRIQTKKFNDCNLLSHDFLVKVVARDR